MGIFKVGKLNTRLQFLPR